MAKKNSALVSRIKRLMQADDDVGKIAQGTPVAIAHAMELFVEQLAKGAREVAQVREEKTLSAAHLKKFVNDTQSMDFLKEIVEGAPELQDKKPPAKRQRKKAEGEAEGSEEGSSRGRGRGRGGRGRGRGRGSKSKDDKLPESAAERQKLESGVKDEVQQEPKDEAAPEEIKTESFDEGFKGKEHAEHKESSARQDDAKPGFQGVEDSAAQHEDQAPIAGENLMGILAAPPSTHVNPEEDDYDAE